MAETAESGIETLTLGEFARKRGIDYELLRLLTDGGHIAAIPTRNGSHRLPADSPLTSELAEEKGRAAYDDLLETVGRLVMKTQSQMRRLLSEIEEQQDHLDDVIPLGPGLANADEHIRGRDQRSLDTMFAVHQLIAWNRVLCSIDDMHRFHERRQANAEKIRRPSTAPVAAPQPTLSDWGERPTPLADELPDGVDDLSPEARRSVIDLLRVLVVAESGRGEH